MAVRSGVVAHKKVSIRVFTGKERGETSLEMPEVELKLNCCICEPLSNSRLGKENILLGNIGILKGYSLL